MAAITSTVDMHSGDSKTLEMEIRNADGSLTDITGVATLRFGISKKDTTDTTGARPKGPAIVTKTLAGGDIVIIDAPTGRCDIPILPADTAALKGIYYFELEMVLSGETSTVSIGTLNIAKDLME